MTTYIQLLAADLLRRFGSDMSRVAVVFPNKRASLFLNAELARQAAENALQPLWAPNYITISDLYRRHSDLHVADQILLVCRLYDVFCRVTGYQTETLDRFYNWGVLLLSDFDDLDKNMADAQKVFRLVGDIHELDDINYLDDDQRKALQEFFHTFSDHNVTEMRQKFLQLWSRLYDIYTAYRESLRDDKLAYEGMLYRDVIENGDVDFEYDTYCFVGFNMLQEVEQRLFHRLKDAGKALFYWDYDIYYLNPHHEAGHFIGEYLTQFPDALDGADHSTFNSHHSNQTLSLNREGWGESFQPSTINYISAPTENLQARYVHDWLLENDRWKCGARTAIVMADERLLQTIIRSLPEEVDKVNITTGYPLSQSSIVSLLQHLIELQTAGLKSGTREYRPRYVKNVMSHPYTQYVTEELLFTDLDTISLPDYDHLSQNVRMTLYLQQVVRYIAQHNEGLSSLDTESLYRTHQILQRLQTLSLDGTLAVDFVTFRRLLLQIINTTTVPYHGEPVEGIQIMGVLETRCLDFDHVLLLSCNEGNMPKGVNDSSFIPHSVRSAYGLTTVENKVGIYSYYFHRLLQRCGDATITYNSSTEGMNTGEMSRFMLQLMVESPLPIRRFTLQAGQESVHIRPKSVEKDEQTMARINKLVYRTISPSSLSTYLRCQLKYYYQHIMGLKEFDDDEGEEVLDSRVFGNIFHDAAYNIYEAVKNREGYVSVAVIDNVLKDDDWLLKKIDAGFSKEFFHTPVGQQNEYTGLQIINRRVILRLVKEMLTYDKKFAPFKIEGAEVTVGTSIRVGERTVQIGGKIDRLDIVGNANQGYRMRVVDYKTGNMEPKKLAMTTVDDIFQPAMLAHHSDYYLQTMLYSLIVRGNRAVNKHNLPVSPSLMFVQRVRGEGYDMTLKIGDKAVFDVRDYEGDYLRGLQQLITDIFDPQLSFEPTDNPKTCEKCAFAQMCGM